MSERVWMITGASRGIGAALARAVLSAGQRVVATGRRPRDVVDAVGASQRMLATVLDVTSGEDAVAAAKAAVERFGRIDVLVNNAGASFKGYFEEMSPARWRRRSRRSGSTRRSSTLVGSGPASPAPSRSCGQRTEWRITPPAAKHNASGGWRRTGSRPATPTSWRPGRAEDPPAAGRHRVAA